MPRKKALKKREVVNFPNVFSADNHNLLNDINTYFANKNGITLEIGCGDGDYSIALAERFPERNFIGIDIKSDRIYQGSSIALEKQFKNVLFVTGRFQLIFAQFKMRKVDEIIIPFPDPHVRRKSAPRRLISNEFLEIYKSIISPEGTVHFKTDNDDLFQFGIDNIEKQNGNIIHINRDVHSHKNKTLMEEITTRFERHYVAQGRSINYIQFNLTNF